MTADARTRAFAAVVDSHREAADIEYTRKEQRDQRQREVSVRDRTAEGTFPLFRVIGLVTAILCLYASAAVLLSMVLGRTVLPI